MNPRSGLEKWIMGEEDSQHFRHIEVEYSPERSGWRYMVGSEY